MHFDLPDCKRCCLCVPLRHGILIFGYLNLMFSFFFLTLEIWVDVVRSHKDTHTLFTYRGVGIYAQLWFSYFLYILEIIFNVVLLVGAHKKNTKLIHVYYYYGIATTLAAFLTYIVARPFYQFYHWYDSVEMSLAFSGLVLQCYLLLIIRSELKKLQYQRGQFHYVNHMAEVLVDPIPHRELENSL